jgi:hypothetical protein
MSAHDIAVIAVIAILGSLALWLVFHVPGPHPMPGNVWRTRAQAGSPWLEPPHLVRVREVRKSYVMYTYLFPDGLEGGPNVMGVRRFKSIYEFGSERGEPGYLPKEAP